jgi:hypothetical protein
VARTFNAMAGQLETAAKQRQEFDMLRRNLIAWAGHGLRTPLTFTSEPSASQARSTDLLGSLQPIYWVMSLGIGRQIVHQQCDKQHYHGAQENWRENVRIAERVDLVPSNDGNQSRSSSRRV